MNSLNNISIRSKLIILVLIPLLAMVFFSGFFIYSNYTKKIEYENTLDIINFCDRVYQGTTEAAQYLEQFPKENTVKYKQRKHNCAIDNYVRRTVNSIRNIIFRKEIDTTNITNTKILDLLNTVDLKHDINTFAKSLTTNLVKQGYTWILVDNMKAEYVETAADELELGMRPYLVNIDRQNVINWKVNSNGTFDFVVIREFYSTYKGLKEEIKEQIERREKVRFSRSADMFSSIVLYNKPEVGSPAEAKIELYSALKEKHNDYLAARFSGNLLSFSDKLLKKDAVSDKELSLPVEKARKYSDL